MEVSMLYLSNLHVWYADTLNGWLENNPVLLTITKELYKKEFKKWLAMDQLKEGEPETFKDYIDEVLEYEQEYAIEILEAFAKKKGYKAVILDAHVKENEDWWTITIDQLAMDNKNDLQEIIEAYMDSKGMPSNLSELVIDKLVGE
jgi:hypothetical protein